MRNAEFDREQVLRGAMTAFMHKGYTKTSMQDLTQATAYIRALFTVLSPTNVDYLLLPSSSISRIEIYNLIISLQAVRMYSLILNIT